MKTLYPEESQVTLVGRMVRRMRRHAPALDARAVAQKTAETFGNQLFKPAEVKEAIGLALIRWAKLVGGSNSVKPVTTAPVVDDSAVCVALSAGGKVKLPKGANGVQATYLNGNVAKVLKKDLVTMKDAGIATEVQPVNVPNGAKGRPAWDKATIVQGEIKIV